jgi:hypothetical protein
MAMTLNFTSLILYIFFFLPGATAPGSPPCVSALGLVGIKDHTLEIKVGLGLHVVNGGGDQVSCQWNVKDGRCITRRQSHKGPTN